METSANSQAILLLTTHFAKTRHEAAKPLTPGEWGQFAGWMKSRALTPESLLKDDLNPLLQDWRHRTVSVDRIKRLLNRGAALSLSLEKWLRGGLWVMTRSDSDYPLRLKQRLGGDSPAVLFGCGRRALLTGDGIAVVGSRNARPGDIDYSRKLGALISQSGHSVVSGAARGVDEAAMLGALEDEGTAVGVTADSLLRACTSTKYRRHLADKNLALISPFNPEADFNVGNAMQRNKYIYCLADAAVVVHSGRKGGTWNGAIENLKKNWAPLWVKKTSARGAGNPDLIGQGAGEIPADTTDITIDRLLESCRNTRALNEDLLERAVPAVAEQAINASLRYGPNDRADDGAAGEVKTSHAPPVPPQHAFYRLFLTQIQPKCSSEPQSADDLASYFDIKKSQLNDWLKRAVSEGRLEKLDRPVRYQWIEQKKIF